MSTDGPQDESQPPSRIPVLKLLLSSILLEHTTPRQSRLGNMAPRDHE